MFRYLSTAIAVVLICAQPALSQPDASALESYFIGRQVGVKIDLPGSEKGIDLKFNKPAAMDWNDYSSRIKTYSIAIHKGEIARVTKFVVKSDMIEFQLNGGGFGTAHDNTDTTVVAVTVLKSDREKDLEKQLAATNDPRARRDIQQQLDRERDRRDRINAANQNEAAVASQLKQQQVAEERLRGGSRINLRWQGSVPSDSLNPQFVMGLLAEYIDFNPPPPRAEGPPPPPPTAAPGSASPLKRGMTMDQVRSLLGRGQPISDTVSPDGLATRVLQYDAGDNFMVVTFVENVVVRYSITSK